MKFLKSFSTPDPVPAEGIQDALDMMTSGHMFRYNPRNAGKNALRDGQGDGSTLYSDVALLEKEFCEYTGHKYAVAVNSCGSALFLALKGSGLQHGDKVFSNAFTFTAVPSSIVHAGGVPVYIECNSDYILDLDDLKQKIAAYPDVRYLMLSYMRGHISDVEQIQQLCSAHHITLIEDCAHSLGVVWKDEHQKEGKHIGHHGSAACFSAQSNKLINSGEGGVLTTNDPELAAYCTLAAGSYERLYQQHLARPEDAVFERIKLGVPNFSLRMSNLTAAVLRPQMRELDSKIARYAALYDAVDKCFESIKHVETPNVLPQVSRVGDSFQFNVKGLPARQIEVFRDRTKERGVELQIFGHTDNARYFRNWEYSFETAPDLQQTDDIISAACDFRIPISFTEEDLMLITDIIGSVLNPLYE